MGGEISGVTNLDRLLASPGLSTPIFTLIGYRATVSASNFQVLSCRGLTRFDCKKLYPFFGWPSL